MCNLDIVHWNCINVNICPDWSALFLCLLQSSYVWFGDSDAQFGGAQDRHIFQCGLEEIFIGTLSQAMSALYVALYTKPVFSKQLTVGILQIQWCKLYLIRDKFWSSWHNSVIIHLKGVVHFTHFNLLTPMSFKMSISFFLQSKRNEGFWWKKFQDFLHIMNFIGNQTIQGPNDSFSAASKGFKRFQMMNKGLIKRNDRSFKK